MGCTAHLKKKNWQRALDDFFLVYRATPHPSTAVTPASIMFPERQFKTRLPCYSSNSYDSDMAVTDYHRKVMALAKQYANKCRYAKQSTIKVEDSVLVHQRKNGN
jgi:hypothetical protein